MLTHKNVEISFVRKITIVVDVQSIIKENHNELYNEIII